MLPPLETHRAIEQTVKEQWGRILAVLIKSTGDMQLAEDVLQDAATIALTRWPHDGIPDSPAAWLIQTARRKALDRFRKVSNFDKLQPELQHWLMLSSEDEPDIDQNIPDKRLELMFTCCHPSLEQKTQVALTLRTLGGLTTDEIASAFLDKPQTMAQRLARAKKKIAAANVPYRVPEADKLTERLAAVLAVIYFIFNEGYSASTGRHITRTDLCEEAIRLARITATLLPQQIEVDGLLALMLLHDSRRYARQTGDGDLILLQDQNRNLWDKQKIIEGIALLKKTLKKQRVGPYQVQASISALHAESSHWNDTDWPQISALYDLLYNMQPSPVIRINQAVALSYSGNLKDALAMLEAVAKAPDIAQYQPFYAAKADVSLRAGHTGKAKKALQTAIKLTTNEAEKRFLKNKLDTISSTS
ncbi:MAG: RNA polymerase sigma factor [Pseudomonadota bacterium]